MGREVLHFATLRVHMGREVLTLRDHMGREELTLRDPMGREVLAKCAKCAKSRRAWEIFGAVLGSKPGEMFGARNV